MVSLLYGAFYSATAVGEGAIVYEARKLLDEDARRYTTEGRRKSFIYKAANFAGDAAIATGVWITTVAKTAYITHGNRPFVVSRNPRIVTVAEEAAWSGRLLTALGFMIKCLSTDGGGAGGSYP